MEKKYQIFISSTYKDLIEARSKVRDAILSMMHFPVGMEMFNAADEEQWEIIQETIDSSDYYPIEKAEERFMSDLNPVYGLLKNSMDGMQPFYSARSLPIIDPAIFNNSNSSVFESISIRDNSIFAECNQLPHKDDTEFDGIYIVPARKGKFKVSVSLMCSEYIEPKVHDIEFEIV